MSLLCTLCKRGQPEDRSIPVQFITIWRIRVLFLCFCFCKENGIKKKMVMKVGEKKELKGEEMKMESMTLICASSEIVMN